MLKRIFWLGLVALAGWLAWVWLRGRQREFSDHTPQLARSPFVAPPPPAAGPYERADDDQVTMDETPATAEPTMIVPAAPAAPVEPLAEPYERADDDQVASGGEQPADDEIMGYCVRCRTKRPIQGAQLTTSESGRRAARGTCPVCGAKMYTFLAAEE